MVGLVIEDWDPCWMDGLDRHQFRYEWNISLHFELFLKFTSFNRLEFFKIILRARSVHVHERREYIVRNLFDRATHPLDDNNNYEQARQICGLFQVPAAFTDPALFHYFVAEA